MNILSTVLFGDHSLYQPYLPAALRAHHNLFRGWRYRIYHDERIETGPYARQLRALADCGLVELVLVTDDALIEKWMLRRLLPIWDEAVDRFLARDVDSIACWRERRAVETWMRSGLAVHAFGDLRGHHDWCLVDGAAAFCASQTRCLLDASDFEQLLARAKWPESMWGSKDRMDARDPLRASKWTGNNLYFLATHVWPLVVHDACEHRINGVKTFGAKLSLTEIDPFAGEDLGVPLAIREGSDALIPFFGAAKKCCPTFDLAAVLAFYRRHGDPEIERVIIECEGGSNVVE